MSFVVSSDRGTEISPGLKRKPYLSAIFGVVPSTAFFWEYLDDFWKHVSNPEVFETCWKALIKLAANELYKLYQYDRSKSLQDIGVGERKRWKKFTMNRSSFDDMALVVPRLTTEYVRSDDSSIITFAASQNNGYLVELNNTITSHTSLQIGCKITLTNLDAKNLGHCCIGYTNETLSSGHGIVIFGNGAVGIICYDNNTIPNLAISSKVEDPMTGGHTVTQSASMSVAKSVLSNSTEYALTLTIEKLKSTLVVLQGTTTVATLTLDLVTMPFVSAVDYTRAGHFCLSHAYLNMAQDQSSDSDTTSLNNIAGTWSTFTYFDPTFAEDILALPSLVTRLNLDALDTYRLQDEIEYNLESTFVDFKTLPERVRDNQNYWAEYVIYDSYTIYNNFGIVAGVDREVDSAAYLNKVVGLFASYLGGATEDRVALGVHAIMGHPITRKGGAVRAINHNYSEAQGEIVIDEEAFLYNKDLSKTTTTNGIFTLLLPTTNRQELSVQVGTILAPYQRLSWGVEIADFVQEPDWIIPYKDVNELQELEKYSTVLISVHSSISSTQLADIQKFIRNRRRPGTKYVVTEGHLVTDDLGVTDVAAISLEDIPHWVLGGHTMITGETITLGGTPYAVPGGVTTEPLKLGGLLWTGCTIPGEDKKLRLGLPEPDPCIC